MYNLIVGIFFKSHTNTTLNTLAALFLPLQSPLLQALTPKAVHTSLYYRQLYLLNNFTPPLLPVYTF